MRIACLLLLCGCLLLAAEPDVLPGTTHWSFPADVSAEQYGELERYLNTEIQSVLNNRRPAADPGAARKELRRLIGAVDSFLPQKPQGEELRTSRVHQNQSCGVACLADRHNPSDTSLSRGPRSPVWNPVRAGRQTRNAPGGHRYRRRRPVRRGHQRSHSALIC